MCGNHGIDGIVAPSVLASNFADLGNEVKRMMDNGAQWVHMGTLNLAAENVDHLKLTNERSRAGQT